MAGTAPSSKAPVRSVYDRYARPATERPRVSTTIRAGAGGRAAARSAASAEPFGRIERVAAASRYEEGAPAADPAGGGAAPPASTSSTRTTERVTLAAGAGASGVPSGPLAASAA